MVKAAWLEIGWIGRPHGLKGDFLVTGDAMPSPPPSPGSPVRLGQAGEEYRLDEIRWMPKGWVVRLAGIDSPEAAKRLQRTPLYCPQENSSEDDAYSPNELQGYVAVDAATGAECGVFDGIEFLPNGPDRWWFKSQDHTWAVPAVDTFIRNIDHEAKRISIERIADFSELAE